MAWRLAALSLFLGSLNLALPRARLPKLGGLQARYYQDEVVRLFFRRAEQIQKEKGRPMRLQLVGGAGKTHIYAMIAKQSLSEHPSRRVVILVPWRQLALQTCRKLRSCGLRTAMLGDGQSAVDPSASVVVCVYNSAQLLRGQHFRVKIMDEAHHLTGGCLSDVLHNDIAADLRAEFTATFTSSDVDYVYSFEQAVHDGFVCDLQSYILPLVYRRQDWNLQISKLAEIISKKSFEWSPMLVLFNKLSRAKAFATILRSHGVVAQAVAHQDGKKHREMCKEALAEGELQAMCCVKIFNEGADIPELRTVVIAETRPSSDVGVLQAVMRALRLHKNKPNDVARVVEVVNATGSDLLVSKKVKRSYQQLAALWEGIGTTKLADIADLKQVDPKARLQLLNPSGEVLKSSNHNFWRLLEDQGRPRRRETDRTHSCGRCRDSLGRFVAKAPAESKRRSLGSAVGFLNGRRLG